jgi:acetyltransferase EpsM
MVEIVNRVNQEKKTWNFLGLLEADKNQAGQMIHQSPVLGSYTDVSKFPKAYFLPYNKWRRSIPLPLDRVASLVDPTVFVSRTAQIGKGCVFYPHCYIGLQAHIGNFVFCLSNSVINHDNVIEDGVIITSGVTLAGGVHVEEDCYLGQSCNVREHLRVGRESLIGMGAVITKNVQPRSVMIGNPARKLRTRNKSSGSKN